MRIEGLIAVRYLFARRQRSVVNIISWISLVGLMVSTAALIIVLSVYNGIGELTKSLFNTFDPELVVEPAEGKTFRLTEIPYSTIAGAEGVAEVVPLASESAWITYGDQQAIVTLRGVGEGYARLTGLDTLLADGRYDISDHTLILGGEIFHRLGMRIPSPTPATVHIPKRGTTSLGMTMDEAFNIAYAYPAANFFIQQDIDRRYVVTDIALVRRLMDYAPDECTALALRLAPGADAAKVKRELNSSLLTPHSPLLIKDRYDQQPLYFKVFRTERLGIYLILSLIVLISTLSLVASLSLLIINKRGDIFMLRSMGMTARQVRRSFLAEGLLICAVAVAAGLLIGFVVCFLQQQFGLIRMGDGNFVVEAFPVAMRAQDFLWTFLLVMVLSSLSVALTVRRARI
ncbi:MAG: FtsX-like permease family protein [Bacteroidales bacterium]|nr:FtsX-like permease family protein [Bacteroidales bacterium]